MPKLSYLSPEAQDVLTKACAYYDIDDGPLFPEDQKLFAEPAAKPVVERKINIASGEDVYDVSY